ncbi:CASP-like protein 4A3, partial [Olea europaea var. sylvestris]|uniref:CASP-like protein 4A3 n=1 Tax=Olea europaea var. sylvestris TaxID=158386 RepID=UPI000C1D18AF
MENTDPSNHNKTIMTSSSSHISISDTESTTSQVDSFHSPLRSESPLRSDDPYFQTENVNVNVNFISKNNNTSEAMDKYYAVPSPRNLNLMAVSPVSVGKERKPRPHSEKPTSENLDFSSMPVVGGGKFQPPYLLQSENLDFDAKSGLGTSPVLVYNRSVKEESAPGVTKVGAVGGDIGGFEEGNGGRPEEVDRERQPRAVGPTRRRSRREMNLKRAALGFRAFEVIVCLISFSVMAADKTKGWSGDSFDRYKEFRYLLSMNVIAFVYSGFQACDLTYHLVTGKNVISHQQRYHFDFSMDQASGFSFFFVS